MSENVVVAYLRSLFSERDAWGGQEHEFSREPSVEDRETVAAWEERTGFVLPADYRESSLRFAGFQFGEGVRPVTVNKSAMLVAHSVDFFLTVQFDDEARAHTVDRDVPYVHELFERSEYQASVSDWRFDLVPIAGHSSFGLWCLDYRFDRQNPPVIYADAQTEWDGDRWTFAGLTYGADSFCDFVYGIEYPDAETGEYPTTLYVTGERSAREVDWIDCRQRWLELD